MKLAADSRFYRHVLWGLCAVLGLVALIPAATRLIDTAQATAQLGPAATTTTIRSITAPGRIRPRDGIVAIAAPAAASGAAIIKELRVNDGDRIERDQVLAVLNGHEEFAAALDASERRIDVARARLTALQAGAKREDIRALQAELEAGKANLAQVAADTQRTRQLRADHVVSAAALEAQQARWSVAARTLDATRARLEGMSSARPADIAVAAAELAAAQADAETARAKLALQYVRAPSAGRVLGIHAYPGQAVGVNGVLSFAQTDEMFVDAEVMEHDIARAHVGQSAHITGDSLATPLQGTLERIGLVVGAREVLAIDPTAFSDARIVHVLIRLNDPVAAERFINARVTAEIAP